MKPEECSNDSVKLEDLFTVDIYQIVVPESKLLVSVTFHTIYLASHDSNTMAGFLESKRFAVEVPVESMVFASNCSVELAEAIEEAMKDIEQDIIKHVQKIPKSCRITGVLKNQETNI